MSVGLYIASSYNCFIFLFSYNNQVQKKNNNVFKRKMKWQGPEEAGKLQYKDLLMRAEKCYPSKSSRSMFTKCCELQQSRQDELENCKRLKTREERKACRRHVKGKGDY